MSFDYRADRTNEASHWIRFRLGATLPGRSLLENEEIATELSVAGLTATSDVPSNITVLRLVAARLARAVAARLGYDSEIEIVTSAGPVKSNAAKFFFDLARQLEQENDTKYTDAPYERIDSLDYCVGRYGGDGSEYVGDQLL